MTSPNQHLLHLNFGIVLSGLTSLFPKIIALSPIEIVFGRSVVAAVALLLVILLSGTQLRLCGGRSDYWINAIVGILLVSHWVSLFHAIQISSVAVGIISLKCNVMMVALLEPLFFQQRITISDICIAAVILLGIYLMTPAFSLDNKTVLGILWGIFSAFCLALRNIIQKRYVVSRSSLSILLYQLIVVLIVTFPFISSSFVAEARHWTVEFILLGLLFTTVPHAILVRSLLNLKATTVSIFSSLQPIYAILFALLVLSEKPPIATLAGGTLVIVASAFEGIKVNQNEGLRTG